MSRFVKTSRRFLLFVVVMLAALLAAETAALAATVKSSGGPITAFAAATADDFVKLSTFGNRPTVPGMQVTINIPPRSHEMLLITFSAETSCHSNFPEGSAACYIGATVDSQKADPHFVVFSAAPDSSGFFHEAHSMQFVAGPLAGGPHVVRIRWSLSEEDMSFVIEARAMTVLRSTV